MVGTWKRLASITLSGTATTISSGTFAAHDSLKVVLYTINTGGSVNAKMQFNSDTGSNYAYRHSADGGADATATSQANIDLRMGELNGSAYSVTNITNLSGSEKVCSTDVVNQNTAGAGTYPSWYEEVSKWANTSANITSIQISKSASGSFAAGSYLTVWGASDDVVNDTTQNSTIFEENDTGKHQIWNSTTSAWVEIS